MVKLAKPINGYKIDLNNLHIIKFPHYTSEEEFIAKQFILSGTLKGEWYADVKLKSRKANWIHDYKEPWRSMWEALTAKRIDLLCINPKAIYIIEVKRYMLSSGIGQLITYRNMFLEEYRPDVPVYLYYVTYYHDPDIVALAKKLGIYTWWMV